MLVIVHDIINESERNEMIISYTLNLNVYFF